MVTETMTGKERIQLIRRHVIGRANTRLQQFMAGTLDVLPCWGDELNELIATELDRVTDPLQIGLWFWEPQ